MPSAWIWTTFALIAVVSFLDSLLRKNKNKKLPPSPRGLPILGHLHLLGKNPHQDLHNLSKQHGPIMHLKFGFVSNIIVSSPHAAEQFLKTHDLVFASRPPHEAAKYIGFGQRNLSFGQYGPYWRNMRKLCTLNLLSNLKIGSFQSMRREELGLLLKSLKQAALNRDVVDISAEVAALNANMSCLMVFGKKYADKEFNERGFKAVIKEGMQLSATPNLGDYYPYLGVLDLQGLTRRMMAIGKVFDEFFEKIIDEHEQSENQPRQADDFVYTMLALMKSGETEFQFDRRHIKAILLVSRVLNFRFSEIGTDIHCLHIQQKFFTRLPVIIACFSPFSILHLANASFQLITLKTASSQNTKIKLEHRDISTQSLIEFCSSSCNHKS